MDARTARNFATLLPKVQEIATKWYDECHAQGIPVVVTDGSRTWAEQDALFAKGRTEHGQIVTKSRGGQSMHNFGIAFDFGIFDGWNQSGGTGEYHDESPLYDKAGKIGEDFGLEWGGDWHSFVDRPHLQYKTGLSLAELQAKYRKGEAYV